MTTIALTIVGLNVRVGMEDNVMYRCGEPLENNAQLVERAVRTARELEREPATPEEARAALGLRGREPERLSPGAESGAEGKVSVSQNSQKEEC